MMRPLTLAELVGPLQAQLIGPDREFLGVFTDSRRVRLAENRRRGGSIPSRCSANRFAASFASSKTNDEVW